MCTGHYLSLWLLRYGQSVRNTQEGSNEHGDIYWGESDMRDKIQMRLNSGMMDSGLVVVVFIISSLIIITFSFLLLVDYEWCHVLYKNNTVS